MSRRRRVWPGNISARPRIEDALLPNILNIVAGGTASLDLPVGRRYHKIHLIYGGTTFDNTKMNNIRILANGEKIHDYTGSRIDTLNQFDKLPACSTYKVLTINFERVGMRDTLQQFFTALNTIEPCPQSPQGIKRLRLEIDIDASAVAPTLAAYAEVSDVNPAQGRGILRKETWFENVASTATEFLHQHPYSGDIMHQTIHRLGFFDTDTNITGFRFLFNGTEKVNRLSKINEQAQAIAGLRSPQSGLVLYDTAEAGNYRKALEVYDLANVQIRTTHTATNSNLPVWCESMGPLLA